MACNRNFRTVDWNLRQVLRWLYISIQQLQILHAAYDKVPTSASTLISCEQSIERIAKLVACQAKHSGGQLRMRMQDR